MKKSAWIVGASTGLGRQVAETLAQHGFSLVLSSRSERDLEALCQHLQNKYNATAYPLVIDLEKIDHVNHATKTIQQMTAFSGFPDICFQLAGNIDERDQGVQSAEYLSSLMQQNFMGPVFLINELLKQRTDKPLRVVVASSIAAARARGKNIAYGTAKRALEQYCSGLMHAFGDSNITIHVYRFGYIDTTLSYGQKLPFAAASPQSIASSIVNDSGKGPGLYYRPRFWWFISFVLNMVPFTIYKKLKF